MISQHITANGAYRLDQPAGAAGEQIPFNVGDGAYFVYSLRGSSFGTSAVVALQYSPDQGATWQTIEGHSSAATPPLIVGSCRGPVYWPAAMLRLSVSGSSGSTDFWIDYATGTV